MGTSHRVDPNRHPEILDCAQQTASSHAAAVATALRLLRAGRVVALPTETVYGLAGLVSCPEALKSIFQMKSRPALDPLIVHIFDFSLVDRFAVLTVRQREVAEALAQKFWPGPLTLVLESRDDVSPLVRSGGPTVALRSPHHGFFRQVLQELGDGVAAPSANMFGHISPTTAAHVASEFPDSDLVIFDGGPCRVGIESTIVRVTPDGQLRVLRPGVITAEQLAAAVQHGGAAGAQGAAEEGLLTPGTAVRHYAPVLPAFVLDQVLSGRPDALVAQGGDRYFAQDVVVLDYGSQLRAKGVAVEDFLAYLNPVEGDDLEGFTRELFASLRKAEAVPGARAVALHYPVKPGDAGARWSAAIWDRLNRAASGRSARLVSREVRKDSELTL